MFVLDANKNSLTVRQRESVTSGSVNVYQVQFEFSRDWDGLEKTAVFRAGKKSISVALGADGTCSLPWEVLSLHGLQLSAGVYGTREGDMVLPTVWAGLGVVLEGAEPGENAKPPAPELWEQVVEQLNREIAGKGDSLGYTEDGELGLYSGENLLSVVLAKGGTDDHRCLSHRGDPEQHPMSSIEGLEEELSQMSSRISIATEQEVNEMLNEAFSAN